MNFHPKAVVLTMVLAGVLLVGVCVAMRRSPQIASRGPVMVPSEQRAPAAPKSPVFKPAQKTSESQVAVAMENARLRSTYQNFRTAVAVGNAPLQKSLRAALKKNREAARRIAEEEVNRSGDPKDREIALRTLEALDQ